MKAINTKYKGYYFRSRLEAKWAVYFDSLGIKWEYEKEGYHFEDGTNYLCDFWLTDLQMWAEVKPKELTLEEMKKVENLVNGSQKPVLLLIGIPERKPYYAVEKIFGIDENFYMINYALSNFHNYPEEENRFYCNFEDEEIFESWFDDIDFHVNNSKSARFEFGDLK